MSTEPLAYKGVPLKSHHARVAALVSRLFERMLKARTPVALELDRYTGLEGTLYHTAVLSGLLHDIGKASRHYRREGPYPYHELLSGIIIHRGARAAIKRGWDGLACILGLASWAVSRHHVAMTGRHPRDGAVRREGIIVLIKALGMMDPGDLSNSIPGTLKMGGAKRILDLLRSQLPPTPDVRGAVSDGLRGISDYDEKGSSPIVCGLTRSYWVTAVELVTGPLIVSDILAARFEGRDTDEGAMPAYARSWLAELRAHDVIKTLEPRVLEGSLARVTEAIADLID